MAHVPSFLAVRCPRVAVCGTLVDDGSAAKRNKRTLVVVERAVEMFFSGQLGIESGCSEKVHS
jgi:hypothetical protein